MTAVPSLPPEWSALFAHANLIREFGPAVVARALPYVTDGRVRRVQATSEVITAEVAGTRPWPYQVLLEPFEPIGGYCTCPVENDCKHVVALALLLGRHLRGADDWEQRLASVLPVPPTEAAPLLGLRLELLTGAGDGSAVITLKPVRPGKRGGWVQAGASWHDLVFGTRPPYGQHPARADLVRLRQLALRHPGSAWQASPEPDLAVVGPALWTLLARVTAAGVHLVHGRDGAVAVGAPVTPRVDAGSDGGGDVMLRPGFVPANSRDLSEVDDSSGAVPPAGRGPGDPVPLVDPIPLVNPVPLGDPVFAVAATHGDDLGLWPLDPLPDELFVSLLTGPPVRVPAADVPRFRSWFLPRLRRVTTVGSSDGSVELPADPVPELLARVRHLPDHVTELDLTFRYRPDGDDAPPAEVPITRAPDAYEPANDEAAEAIVPWLRDPEAEQALLDRHLSPDRFGREPRSYHRFSGRDTVDFVSQVLPRLLAEGVDVESEGEAPSYSLPEAAPVIEFDIDDRTDPDDASEAESTDWFDLAIVVTVDGQRVPMIPLLKALSSGEQLLVLDSGLVLDLRREEFDQMRELLAAARALGDPEAGALSMRPEQVGVWEELQAYGVVRTETTRWRKLVGLALAEVSDDGTETPVPAGLQAELRPYQRAGFGWLDRLWRAGLGGVLADDMGLGKTLQVLAAVLAAKHRSDEADAAESAGPVLVVAPTSVVPNWVSEAARFTPDLRVTAVTATRRRRGTTLGEAIAGADVVVTTYGLLRLEEEAYARVAWSALVLDEAQQVKNHRAKGYRAVRRLRVPVRFAVTGTPLENSLMELWSMLSIAAPGLFPDPEAFATDVAKPIDKGNREVLAMLRRRIRPLMLRRTKELVAADLPPKQEQTLVLPLDDKHRKLYDTRLARERQRVLGLLTDLDANRIEVLQALTTLRQLALSPALVDPEQSGAGSAKIDVLVEHLRELAAEGHRALVFSQFTRFLDLIGDRLDRAAVSWTRLDGSMTIPQRDKAVGRFRDGSASAFLISLKAGGFGLNLTEADYVFVMDPWWNPAAEAQAIDRTHRIGQTRPVHVYRLLAEDTIEAKVAALQQRKRDLFTRVVDAEAGLADARLSADDLRELFS
ncbi:SNF2-related protein [Propionibacteriaceae bacterium Y2011]